MTTKSSWRGAITVYLSIILSAVILFSGVLMDIVRIRAAEVQVRRAANTAAMSALAGYHTKLKEDYGAFALNENERPKVEETIKSYLEKSLLVNSEDQKGSEQIYNFLKSIVIDDKYRDVHFANLYDYRIESVQVVPVYNLTENEITRQQIAEYMKYRAPAQFVDNFIDKLNYASSTSDLTDAYKQKTAIEKKLDKIEESLIRLQADVDKLNKFKKNDFDNKGSGSLLEIYIQAEIERTAYGACSSVNITSDDKEKQKVIEGLIKEIRDMYHDASHNAENAREQMDEQLSECILAAQDAKDELNGIKALIDTVEGDISALKSRLNEIENAEGQDEPQISAALKQDIEKWEGLVESENSGSIADGLDADIQLLADIEAVMVALPGIIHSRAEGVCTRAVDEMRSAVEDGGTLNISGMTEYTAAVEGVLSTSEVRGMASSAQQFEAIKEVLMKSGKKQGKDPRRTIADTANTLKEEVEDKSKISKRIEEPILLPSYSINSTYPNKVFSEGVLQTDGNNYNQSSGTSSFNVDFDEDSSYTEDTFGHVTALAAKLKNYAKEMSNEIYINEYILATFKDEVEIKDSNTDSKINDTLFNTDEVEYIISGGLSEALNFTAVKGEILLIRFGMNTLHVYSDPQKRLKALEIATATAGFTGFGIPVVHNLIMCSWGMAETFQDMNDLYKGKRVPFIKTAQTWRTDLIPGGYKIDNDVQTEGSLMDFDYHDYLRLLLLVENKDVKMNRIEDLIQLNMQKSNPEFKLCNFNTYIKVNVQVSMRYWFLTRIFTPSRLKTPDGRHIINIEAWKGY